MLRLRILKHTTQLPREEGGGLLFLFISSSLRTAAMIFLALFSPLYVWKIAKASLLSDTASLVLALGFFLLLASSKLLALPAAEILGRALGFKKTIHLSKLPLFVAIPMLAFAADYPLVLPIAAVLIGIEMSLFWWGYHGFFVEAGKPSYFGREMGVANILNILVVVVTPLLGALVVELFSFNALFFLAALFALASFVVLYPAKDHKPRVKAGVLEVIKLIVKHKKVALAYFGEAAQGSLLISVWPIFLFTTLGTIISVGQTVSLSALIAAAFTFLVGFWVDKRKQQARKIFIVLGSPLIAATWVARALARSAATLIFVDASFRLGNDLTMIPLDVWAYQKAAHKSVDRAMMFREINVSLGPIVITTILIFWVLFVSDIASTFLVAAVFSLFPLLAIERNKLPRAIALGIPQAERFVSSSLKAWIKIHGTREVQNKSK